MLEEKVSDDIPGCRGARACDLSFFDDARYILEIDRKGASDVVQIGKGDTLLCAADFIPESILSQYGYQMVKGGKTDVVELKIRGLGIPVCNIGCGYYNAHTSEEYTVFSELTHALHFVQEILKRV
jgi:di/tripeptidase